MKIFEDKTAILSYIQSKYCITPRFRSDVDIGTSSDSLHYDSYFDYLDKFKVL